MIWAIEKELPEAPTLLLYKKEGVSKLTFACYLFLFRHGLHGKYRFSLFFFRESAKSVPKRNHHLSSSFSSSSMATFSWVSSPFTMVSGELATLMSGSSWLFSR